MCFGLLAALLHRESDKEGSADDKTPLAAVRGLPLHTSSYISWLLPACNLRLADHFCMFRAHTGRACGSLLELFFFFSGAKLCQSWLQWAGMQLYLRCHSGIRSAVCSFDKGTSSQRAGLIRTCWSQSEEIAFWSRRTSVCGKLKMAKNHHSHFSAPVVTKAHWKKPSHVSSFDVETCGIEDITRWQTAEGIWQRSQQRLGRLPYKVRLKLQNLTAHVACLVKWWTEEKCTFALELFLVPFSAVFHWFKQM